MQRIRIQSSQHLLAINIWNASLSHKLWTTYSFFFFFGEGDWSFQSIYESIGKMIYIFRMIKDSVDFGCYCFSSIFFLNVRWFWEFVRKPMPRLFALFLLIFNGIVRAAKERKNDRWLLERRRKNGSRDGYEHIHKA